VVSDNGFFPDPVERWHGVTFGLTRGIFQLSQHYLLAVKAYLTTYPHTSASFRRAALAEERNGVRS
jgi:hypothetical protein